MPEYKTYIARKRARFNAACGPVDIPYGTELTAEGEFICMDGQPLCETDNQTALDFFCQNDDGQGLERGALVEAIETRLKEGGGWMRRNKVIDVLWMDDRCQSYRRLEYQSSWIWKSNFYNAPLDDLLYIAALIGAQTA